MTASPQSIREIGKTTFGPHDQERFASISGDRNPMHMDPIAARRLQAGCQVVHGIHIVLAALEFWRNDDDLPLGALNCTFSNPVCVGEEVVFTQYPVDRHACAIEAKVRGLPCSRIVLSTGGERGAQDSRAASVPGLGTANALVLEATQPAPMDEAPQSHVGKTYVLSLDSRDLSPTFPKGHACLGREGLSALAALSYFVGMVCPGLHSIFSSLSFEVGKVSARPESLVFRVRKYDERFRLFDIDFEGAIRGGLKAFLRPPPQEQPSFGDITARIPGGEFGGIRALVVGGSRGLGEMTAKILAAGGANVLITYATGFEDATRIRDEINRGSRGKCELMKLDLAEESYTSMDIDVKSIGAIYFFATPRIFRKRSGVFEASHFAEFCEFYLTSFYEMCVFFENRLPEGGKVKVFFPSSVAVQKRPKGMTEYSMAKAAAEVLIEEINRSFRKVSVMSARLPRLQTDQTSSVISVASESNLDVLLPVIRSMAA